ncbi:thylakoid membrane protein slr0575-like [Zingiber officinale]|uniref:thylakoid membrane protein slr0575-like n=1 Tax=Zingiber officinale TaxID=94328 RepID=UPI001C4CCEA6|nr:thylakoid membrane protein slr0575-like [Zingiber officinale]
MFIAGAVASPAAACSLSRFGFQPAEVAISHPKLLSSNWRPPVGRPLLPTHGRFSCRRLVLVASAADSTQPSSAAAAKTIVPDNGFSFSKVSFGVIGLAVGGSLLSYGFGAYFTIFPGSEWSAILLTYGFPLTVIGMALKYAELKPVPCITYNDAEDLREKCATPILKQVRNDVTRFRYGDEQHLDEALKRIFQYGLGGGIPRRSAPILRMIREEVTEDGRYCLVLVFEAKALRLSDFEQRQAKFTSFFGPGIAAEIGKGGEADFYEVRLISQTTSEPSSQS